MAFIAPVSFLAQLSLKVRYAGFLFLFFLHSHVLHVTNELCYFIWTQDLVTHSIFLELLIPKVASRYDRSSWNKQFLKPHTSSLYTLMSLCDARPNIVSSLSFRETSTCIVSEIVNCSFLKKPQQMHPDVHLTAPQLSLKKIIIFKKSSFSLISELIFRSPSWDNSRN